MSITDEVLTNNEDYAARFSDGELPMPPARNLAVVACMDARMVVTEILGIGNGDAHIIRNAGGIVNQETLRSLLISTRLLGTREIIVLNHTDCGMHTFKDEELLQQLREETRQPVDPIPFYSFKDSEQNVRWQVDKIKSYPLLPPEITVRGFVYDVTNGRLSEIR